MNVSPYKVHRKYILQIRINFQNMVDYALINSNLAAAKRLKNTLICIRGKLYYATCVQYYVAYTFRF